jgi:hypothetical protein
MLRHPIRTGAILGLPIAAVAIAGAIVWSQNATYVREWVDDKDIDSIGRFAFRDTVRRSDDQVVFREIRGPWKDSLARGPMRDGQMHGRWERDHYGLIDPGHDVFWYWYGEQISEGTWHLRTDPK